MVQPPLHPDWLPTSLSFSGVHSPETESHSPEATTVEGTPSTLALELTFRHSGWHADRERVARALNRVEPSIWRINNFGSCGCNAWVDKSDDDPPVYRIRSDRCHDRFCLPCGQERARVIAYNVHERLDARRTRFITLTLRSVHEPLAELLDHLYTSFAKLRRSNLWKGTQDGGVAFLEIKWNPVAGRWHPHLHILAEGKYIAQAALSKAWRKATGDSFIVDVSKVRNIDRAVAYVVKYASKPHDPSLFRDPDRLEEAILALKGRKLCLTFGTWRGVSLTPVPDRGTWTPVAPLADLIRQARSGDVAAARIVASISTTALPADCRDPPDDLPLPSDTFCTDRKAVEIP